MEEGALNLLDELSVDRFNVVSAVAEATGMSMAVRVSRQDGATFVWEGATTMKVLRKGEPDAAGIVCKTDELPTLMRFLGAAARWAP